MSKESSIKVFAENFSGSDKPVNAISVWLENASDISGGGGSSFDPTYMSGAIDNKLNKDEVGFRNYLGTNYVSGVSGKKIFSDKATSASKSYEAEWANTANYDSNGNYIAQTYNDLTALNSFVQSNSAQWSQGGGSDTDGNILLHKNCNGDPGGFASIYNNVSGVSDLYFECCTDNDGYSTPDQLIISLNGGEISRVYWTQVSSDGSFNYYSGSCNGLQTNNEYNITSYGGYNWCYMSANGYKITPTSLQEVYCTTNSVMKFNANGNNITGNIAGNDGHGFTQLTSFTGGLSNFTAKGYERYDFNVGYENYGISYNYDFSAEFTNGGSTVASGDVFPPTDSLSQGSKYYLAWNTNNGGLYWEYVGN